VPSRYQALQQQDAEECCNPIPDVEVDFLGHGDLAPAGLKSTPVRGIMLPGPISDS
jgi:hypothetical protein